MFLLKCYFLLQLINLLNANETPRKVIYWDSFSPGQLLHSLNQLTTEIDDVPMQAYMSSTIAPAQPQHRVDNDVASSNYDYDRAYEDFVRKYFTDAASSAFSNENSDSLEEDAISEATRTRQRKQQQCKKVRRKRDICIICRNEKTGEKSETCSYATESAPQEYSYEKASNYKKTRQSSNENDDKDNAHFSASVSDEEEENDEEAENDNEQESATTTKKSGSCTRQQKNGKVCYFCINSAGEKMKECTKLTNTSKRRAGDKKDEHKLQKTQRLYKRTVSFSYENKNSTDGNADKSEQAKEVGDTTKQPQLRKKVIIEILKKEKKLN